MKKIYFLLPLLCLSLSGCQPAKTAEEAEQPDAAGTAEEADQSTATDTSADAETNTVNTTLPQESEPVVTICTGIEYQITEQDTSCTYLEQLEEYLNQNQFAVIKRFLKDSSALYKGDEQFAWDAQDWELVRPLNQITYTDSGYGKTDYNNDGEKEIFYRRLSKGLQVTGYVWNEDKTEITGSYDLLEPFAGACQNESTPRQLWFAEIEGKIHTFCFYDDAAEQDFTLCAFLVEGDTVSLLEKRQLTVLSSEVLKSEADAKDDIFADVTWNFAENDYEAYQLTAEQLHNFRQNRTVRDSITDTALPDELQSVLKEAVLAAQNAPEASYEELLEPYVARSRALTEEEVADFLGESLPEYLFVRCAYLADLDKDGTEELILSNDSNGSAGFADIEIWYPTPDLDLSSDRQSFRCESFMILRGYEELLTIEDNYYFVVRLWNYYSRETYGFEVYSFGTDGSVSARQITLESDENQKDWLPLYESKTIKAETLHTLKEYLTDQKSRIENCTVSNDSYQELYGQAEALYRESDCDIALEAWEMSRCQDMDNLRGVDLDNDKETEYILKQLWLPSSVNSRQNLNISILDKNELYAHKTDIRFPNYAFEGESGSCDFVQIWFEEFDGKVYTFYMERPDRSSDYLLTAALIEDGEFHPVLQYLLLDCKVYQSEDSTLSSIQ